METMKGHPEVGVREFPEERISTLPYKEAGGDGETTPQLTFPIPIHSPAKRIPAAGNHCLSIPQAPAKTSQGAASDNRHNDAFCKSP